MADMNDAIDNASDNMEDTKEKAKNMASRHPMRMGAGTVVALLGAGYLIGHKHAESKSPYNKFMRRISNMH